MGAAAVLGATPAFADKIGDASKKLASASYPFLKSIPWDSDLYAKFPADPQKTLKAIDKALVAAASMDGRALQTPSRPTTKRFLAWMARVSHRSPITQPSLMDWAVSSQAFQRSRSWMSSMLLPTLHPRTCLNTSSRPSMAPLLTKRLEHSGSTRRPSKLLDECLCNIMADVAALFSFVSRCITSLYTHHRYLQMSCGRLRT